MGVKDDYPEIKQLMKGKKINLIYDDDTDKYSKVRFQKVYRGYDMLEDLYTVRTYINKRYKLDRHILEILLKLSGMKLFTRAMYSDISKSFTWSRWDSILDSGYINLVMNHYDVEQRIFTLSTTGRNIVAKFYKYLVGEEKIPLESNKNPMVNKNTKIAFDKKKVDVIKKLQDKEVPEHKRYLFS